MVEVKALGPPHVMKIVIGVGGMYGHASCETKPHHRIIEMRLVVCKGMLPVKHSLIIGS